MNFIAILRAITDLIRICFFYKLLNDETNCSLISDFFIVSLCTHWHAEVYFIRNFRDKHFIGSILVIEKNCKHLSRSLKKN